MDKIEELIEKKHNIRQGGGQDKLEGQHSQNKLTARERINLLLDEGSFIEIGTFLKDSTVIAGYGTSQGKLVYVYSEDYTKNGGLMNKASGEKIANIMEMALKMGAPLVKILDSAGGDIKDGLNTLLAYSKITNLTAKLSGVVPQISLVLGHCAGISAVTAAMSDFTIISKETGRLYVNPALDLSNKEEKFIGVSQYGEGEKVLNNGGATIACDNDKEVLAMAKKIVQLMPSNNMEKPFIENEDNKGFIQESLDEMCKSNKINKRHLSMEIFDDNSYIELFKSDEDVVLTTLGKINGLSVGVMVVAPEHNEYLNIKSLDRLTRFVKLCDSYHIPLVTFVDAEGFSSTLKEEENGLVLSIAKLTYSLAEATTPKVAIIVGKAYGSAYVTLSNKEGAFDMVYAWPNAKIAVTTPEKIIMALNRDEITGASNPKDKEKEVITSLETEITSPYKAAELGFIDDIIVPKETRARLFMTLDMLQTKKVIKYPKNHGTILI
ncbi:acyl-CoA carboxylase subunit beta [Clostridium hydrogeniformans]|uniref:acyl-CoA carboxylase subunit beta n=1 Tax=Clostridium hydrogeniformans TaxID=349933 RepID=UPI000489E4A9|nr:carboxyl transferase domain-containing protein [Clostridium hydrogeniformans]